MIDAFTNGGINDHKNKVVSLMLSETVIHPESEKIEWDQIMYLVIPIVAVLTGMGCGLAAAVNEDEKRENARI